MHSSLVSGRKRFGQFSTVVPETVHLLTRYGRERYARRTEADWKIVDGVGDAARRSAYDTKARCLDVLKLNRHCDLRDITNLSSNPLMMTHLV